MGVRVEEMELKKSLRMVGEMWKEMCYGTEEKDEKL
jgi:hypothetical protein